MSRRQQYKLAAAFAGGGIPGILDYLAEAVSHIAWTIRRIFDTPRRWLRAAYTNPVQTFGAVLFLYLYLGKGWPLLYALLGAAFGTAAGVTAWFHYRYKKTGMTYKQAARQLQMQRQINDRWNLACRKTNLTMTVPAKRGKTALAIPPLKKLTIDKGDITARVFTGQYAIATKDVAKSLELIADTVGCNEVTMRVAKPGELDLRFCFTNPLEKVVKPSAVKSAPKGYVPFGLTESGEAITIPVLNKEGEAEFRSTLIGGVSGGGKSSALWSILGGFEAQEIPVRLRVSDAAGGVELYELGKAMTEGRGTDLFRVHRYAETKAETEAVIKEMLADMFDRLDTMKVAGVRKHKPTPDEPLDILIIDEVLLLKSLLKAGADSDLGQMLSICRKAGFGVIACTQLAEKATLGELRELFPMRIAFRMNTRPQTLTILGDDQADMGPAHNIPRNQQGVGFMYDQATDGMRKFRAMYITDLQTKQIAMGVAPDGMENFGKEPQPVEKPRCVYWHYGYPDPVTGGRELWYVGSASDPDERFKQHEKDRKSRRWWKKTDHSARRIEWHQTQAEGFAAEQEAIERDKPRYNDLHNRDNPARLTDEPAVDDYEVAA